MGYFGLQDANLARVSLQLDHSHETGCYKNVHQFAVEGGLGQ